MEQFKRPRERLRTREIGGTVSKDEKDEKHKRELGKGRHQKRSPEPQIRLEV